jgi:predicted permease
VSLRPGWRRALRLSLGKRSVERDVDDEIAFHLAMREEKLVEQGLHPADAESTARSRFGDPDRVRDECITIDRQYAREVRLMEWLESIWSDFRYALRTLRRMPAFTTVATITLALGIGATAGMFTLVNGILLRPLPYPDSDRLVRLIQSYPEKGLDTWGISQRNIAMYRDGSTDFEAFSAFRSGRVTIRGDRGPERLSVLRVTSTFFDVIGVRPMLGRPFTFEEDRPNQNNVMVLSYGTWQTRFGGNPAIVGTKLEVDETPMLIIGVMPPGFAFPRADVQAWVPMGLDPLRRFGYMNSGLGRLKPGITPEHSERQTTAIMWDWARDEQGLGAAGVDPRKTRMRTIVRPMQEVLAGRTARPLTILFAAVSLILLIATANVATLLSSRAAGRQREIGLRTALGATGTRVVRQLLTESVALALIGAVVGIALAFGGVRLFTQSKLATLPRIDEITVDGRVLAFTLTVSVLSGLLFGLLPALFAARSRITSDLAAGQRESSHRSTRRVNNALVVAQLSLSVVLLIAAGLVLKSFQRLTALDLGFRSEGVTSVVLPIPQRMNNALALAAFVNRTLEQVRAIPGVRSAALGWTLPFEGSGNYDGFIIDGRPVPASGNEDQTYQIGVSPGYFATLGIPLLHGRDFLASDDSTSQAVGIVDETMASRYWKGSEALGKRIRTTGDTTWYTIIGVVGNVHDGDAAMPPEPHLYVSIPQTGGNPLSLAVLTNGDASTVIPAVRREIAHIEPSIPIESVRTLSSVVDQSFATRRLTKILLGGFSVLAVLLAGVGIYGVMSLHVANRNREFGIRLATGADPGALIRLVLREGIVLATIGVGVGIVGALAATRWIQSLLFDVSPTDPTVYGLLSLLLGGIAVASCLLPARRAAKSDPLTVLRSD